MPLTTSVLKHVSFQVPPEVVAEDESPAAVFTLVCLRWRSLFRAPSAAVACSWRRRFGRDSWLGCMVAQCHVTFQVFLPLKRSFAYFTSEATLQNTWQDKQEKDDWKGKTKLRLFGCPGYNGNEITCASSVM